MGDIADLLGLLKVARNFPKHAKAVVAEAAADLGIAVFPVFYSLLRHNGRQWEILAVSLELERLPTQEPGDVLVSGRLDVHKPAPDPAANRPPA